MKIIKITPNENGSRPALQDWNHKTPPSGYAFCPENFVATFYGTSPAGFVNIKVNNNSVYEMEVNDSALQAYIEEMKKQIAESEVEEQNGS